MDFERTKINERNSPNTERATMTILRNATPPPPSNPAAERHGEVWAEIQRLALEAVECESGRSSWSAAKLPDSGEARRCRMACQSRWRKLGRRASCRLEFRLAPGDATLYFRAVSGRVGREAA